MDTGYAAASVFCSTMARPQIVSLEGFLALLVVQQTRQLELDFPEPSYDQVGPLPPPVSAECGKHRLSGLEEFGTFYLKVSEPCSSCLSRDALDIMGIPRREPKSGMRLSYGCEECGGSGSIPVTSKRGKPKNVPGSFWARMGDPYSRDVDEAVSRAKGRR